MKTNSETSITFVTQAGGTLEMTIPKGNTADSLIEEISQFSENYRWHDRSDTAELVKLEDGALVIVDSSFGIVPAYVNKYPSRILLQDVASNSDEGMKNHQGKIFTVEKWKHFK